MDIGSKIRTILDKLTKRNEYSTEERVIGKWIDGKPIYRKMFIFTSTKNFTTNTWTDTEFTTPNVENVLKLYMYAGAANSVFCGNYVNGNFQALNVRNITYVVSAGHVMLVEYTKTTD